MASPWAERVRGFFMHYACFLLISSGMRFSLQTREIIADSIETVTCAQHHDACIAIPGCDKNMPGVIMAFARHNRPSIMVYGGSIKPGYSDTLRKTINISTCYESHGAYIYKTLEAQSEGRHSADEIMNDIEQHACPGAGACGGMYTANTMSTSIEGTSASFPSTNLSQSMLTS
jgi:dihydroxy-acid dehydratase